MQTTSVWQVTVPICCGATVGVGAGVVGVGGTMVAVGCSAVGSAFDVAVRVGAGIVGVGGAMVAVGSALAAGASVAFCAQPAKETARTTTKGRIIARGTRVRQRARTPVDIRAHTGRITIPSSWTRSLECFMMLSPFSKQIKRPDYEWTELLLPIHPGPWTEWVRQNTPEG